ncbi:MAG: sigma-70 family RNA polymerase sigma factor [Thermoguttaceae bacterium]|jgi:RNA polymerase sigma-70 factor (ECF subfamily)
MNDGELIRAVQLGDRTSLTILYQRYLSGVWRYLHAHLARDREEAEDLVSETFLTAIRNIQTYDSQKGNVYGWLIGIARNKLHDHLRKMNRALDYARSDATAAVYADSGNPEGHVIQTETQDAVIRALDSLADEERIVLEWKYMESLSVRDMAERLGRTEKAVEAILYRARISFRTIYARRQMQVE